VSEGEVTLAGAVGDREAKRLAEDLADSVSGVRDVNNQIKVVRPDLQPVGTFGRTDERTGQGGPGGTRGVAGTANTPELTPPKER
jgi:hypothetical protein